MILGNGHLVIVDNDDEVRAQFGTYIQSFEGFTSTQRAIADDGNHITRLPLQVTRLGKSACQTDGGRGMPDDEEVVLAFRRFGISGDFVILVRIHKRCPAACQYLMGITLVRHVIDYLVRW